MNCKIDTTPDFARELKQLAKRYPSMKDDYRDFLDALRKSPRTSAYTVTEWSCPMSNVVGIGILYARYCKSSKFTVLSGRVNDCPYTCNLLSLSSIVDIPLKKSISYIVCVRTWSSLNI